MQKDQSCIRWCNNKRTLLLLLVLCSFSSIVANAQKTDHWESLFYSNANFHYYTSSEGIPPLDWRNPSFDHSEWRSGQGGIGFGDNDDNTIIEACISVCLRKFFFIPDTSYISEALLHIDYDDAFVAFINGVEVARSEGLSADFPAHNQLAGINHEARMYDGGQAESFTIEYDDLMTILQPGDNLFAMQVHNRTLSSSDLSSLVFLSVGIEDSERHFLPTPDWFSTPIPLWNSDLPLVCIDTHGQSISDEPKIDADMKIIYGGINIINTPESVPNIYDGKIGIEVRGATSSAYPQKPYALETVLSTGENNNISLLGMPPENDYVLISHHNEKTFMRNTLAFHLFEQMGHYSPRMRLCQVELNGQYQGIYLFGEKIKQDRWRINISDITPTSNTGDSLTGGYIFKTEYYGEYNTWLSDYSPVDHPNHKTYFAYYQPKYDEITSPQKAYLKDYVDQFQSALHNVDFADHYAEYIDIPSFIDYFLMSELSRNIDGYKKSRYFYKDVDSKGGKLHAGPVWDFDWAWKNIPSCLFQTTDCSGWAYKVNDCQNSPSPGWMVRLLQDPNFSNQVKCRYLELRDSWLSESYITSFLDSIYSSVYEAQKVHFNRWNTLGVRTGAPEIEDPAQSYDEEVARLRNWIEKRLVWLDENMPGNAENCSSPIDDIPFKPFMRIFPNPASSVLNIESDIQIQSVEIIDLLGKKILNASLESSYSAQLDISTILNGIYIMKIRTMNNDVIINQLIKTSE